MSESLHNSPNNYAEQAIEVVRHLVDCWLVPRRATREEKSRIDEMVVYSLLSERILSATKIQAKHVRM